MNEDTFNAAVAMLLDPNNRISNYSNTGENCEICCKNRGHFKISDITSGRSCLLCTSCDTDVYEEFRCVVEKNKLQEYERISDSYIYRDYRKLYQEAETRCTCCRGLVLSFYMVDDARYCKYCEKDICYAIVEKKRMHAKMVYLLLLDLTIKDIAALISKLIFIY